MFVYIGGILSGGLCPGFDSVESLVFCDQILSHWVMRFPSNEGRQEGYHIGNRYFTVIYSSSVRTVADRHRLDAYHNKHC